jgi:TrmH family RNA methyltransferase
MATSNSLPPAELIQSLQNPRVKNLVKLRDRRDRDRQKQFLIEGYREVSRALAKGCPIREIYFSPEWFLGENEPSLLREALSKGCQLYELSKSAFAKCSYRDRPDGLLAVAEQWDHDLSCFTPSESPFLLVIESIEKPGNLGTILRAADAAGIEAVLVCDPITDIFNPNVVRASTGVLFSVPIYTAHSQRMIDFLRERKIQIAVTTPDGDTVYTKSNLRGPLALVMGSEQYGLSPLWLQQADTRLVIPMAGQADSLNVAMATAITLFEAVRQRTNDSE